MNTGSESDARDYVNTAPISSLIDVNMQPSVGGVATVAMRRWILAARKARGHRERFETAHHVATGRVQRYYLADYRARCSAAAPS
jgi:hypothetical protein